MQTLLQDAKYALRTLAKSPSFTAVAVITLALGIGANTAIFSVVDAVLLRPLPYPESGQIVQLGNRWKGFSGLGSVSFPEMTEIRQQTSAFSATALFRPRSFNWSHQGSPERVQAVEASVEIFKVLGTPPQLGRDFTAEEARTGHGNVIIISHGLWQRRFAARPDVIGSQSRLNGESFTIIGVMPAAFYFPDKSVEAWIPLDEQRAGQTEGRLAHIRYAIARLNSGTSIEQAAAQLAKVAAYFRENFPQQFPADSGFNMVPVSYQEQVVGETRTPLLVLLGAVAFVLLIACANVANLFLARAAARERELAIRSALGAARSSLLRQLLVESLLLAFAGAAAGLLIAWWGTDVLAALRDTDVPRLEEARIDARVLAFTLGLSVITGLLFGLAPAWRVTRADLIPALQDAGRGSTGARHRRFRDALVAAEVAISVVLLAGTALLLRSFWQISQVEPGFESAAVLTANLSLSGTQYPTPERRIAFYEQLLARLRSEPGITNAAAASIIPLNGSNDQLFQIEGRPVREGTQMPDEQNRTVTADYFKTMGIALLRGRVFDGRDQRGAPEVVVISDSLAQKYWPGADPVGARIAFGDPQNGAPWVTIVGVVADVRDEQLHLPARPILYVPHSQYAFGAMSLIVRSAGAAPPSEDVLRRHVAALDPEVALYSVRSLQQIVTNSVASQRLNLLLISIFALQALALAAVGVYGVMNYVVQQQTRETGIRMAFGASPGEVLRLYLSRGFKLFGIGLAAGLAGALAVAQFLKTMLYGVAPSDPASYAAISIVLAGVTALACWLPARRAARVDPMVALRHQ